jgi:hypothetical protein
MFLKLLKGERLKLKWQHGSPVENKREVCERRGETEREIKRRMRQTTRRERKE